MPYTHIGLQQMRKAKLFPSLFVESHLEQFWQTFYRALLQLNLGGKVFSISLGLVELFGLFSGLRLLEVHPRMILS